MTEMTKAFADQLTGPFLAKIREQLQKAMALAAAAEACMAKGARDEAITMALDIEVLTYEANVLLNAMSLANRMARA